MIYADLLPGGSIIGFYDPEIHKAIPLTAQRISQEDYEAHLRGDTVMFDAEKNEFRKLTAEEKKDRRDAEEARPENVKAKAEHELREGLESSIPLILAWIVGSETEQTEARTELEMLYAMIEAARDKLKPSEP